MDAGKGRRRQAGTLPSPVLSWRTVRPPFFTVTVFPLMSWASIDFLRPRPELGLGQIEIVDVLGADGLGDATVPYPPLIDAADDIVEIGAGLPKCGRRKPSDFGLGSSPVFDTRPFHPLVPHRRIS